MSLQEIAPVPTNAAAGKKHHLKAGRGCRFLVSQLQSILVLICFPGSILLETVQFSHSILTELLQPVFVLLQAPAELLSSTQKQTHVQMAFLSKHLWSS